MTTTTCPSTHWSLPAPCILPPGHHEVWHEAQFTNGRIRYRRAFGVFATELLRDGEWVELSIAPPETPETEVERLKARVAELETERHSTNEEMSKAVEDLRAKDQRITELETALAATGRSLSSFIFDSSDPGVDALGAQWLYHQALPQADDPFAQPRAFRASVFEEAAKAVLETDVTTDDDHRKHPQAYIEGHAAGVEDAAEHLNLLADQAAQGGAK